MYLFDVVVGSAGRVLVTFAVVHFEDRERGVVVVDIDTTCVVDDRLTLVGFDGRGDGQTVLSVSVEDVDDVGLFDGT